MSPDEYYRQIKELFHAGRYREAVIFSMRWSDEVSPPLSSAHYWSLNSTLHIAAQEMDEDELDRLSVERARRRLERGGTASR